MVKRNVISAPVFHKEATRGIGRIASNKSKTNPELNAKLKQIKGNLFDGSKSKIKQSHRKKVSGEKTIELNIESKRNSKSNNNT